MPNYESILKKLEVEEHTWLITGVAGFIGSNLLERIIIRPDFSIISKRLEVL